MGKRIRVKYGKFFVPVNFDDTKIADPAELPEDCCAYGYGLKHPPTCPMGKMPCRGCIFAWSDGAHKRALRNWLKEVKNV